MDVEIANKKCDMCELAFKALSDHWVLCSYLQRQYEESNTKDVKEFVLQKVYPYCDRPKEIAIGFGCRRKHNRLESHWSYKGTATEGLATNFQILTPKDDWCYHFKDITPKLQRGEMIGLGDPMEK